MLRIDDIPQQVADDMQRQAVDLFRTGDISLKNVLHYGTIQLDKLEFDKGGCIYEKVSGICFSIGLCIIHRGL